MTSYLAEMFHTVDGVA